MVWQARNGLIFILFFMLLVPAHGKIYKWKDKQGQIHYGNVPPISDRGTKTVTNSGLVIPPKNNKKIEKPDEAALKKTRLSEQKQNLSKQYVSAGTGWVSRHGYVVTSYDIVNSSRQINIVLPDGQRMSAYVSHKDVKNNLALLTVSDIARLPRALPIAEQPGQSGASVFTVGYTKHFEKQHTADMSSGTITELSESSSNSPQMHLKMPIKAGNSGGPLLNQNGEVVGIIDSRTRDAGKAGAAPRLDDTDTEAFAVKVERLHALLNKIGHKMNIVREWPKKNDSLEAHASRIKSSVVRVYTQ